jgi:glucose-1-phosphate adenylyltransferase
VPIAGKYRLIDIPVSNCINSGIRSIYVLTQFNSESLHRHIQRTYRFDPFSKGHVRILAAQQTPEFREVVPGHGRCRAPEPALLHRGGARLRGVLSGDQLYRMDFREVMRSTRSGRGCHHLHQAGAAPEAGALGILQVNESRRIVKFVEKPGNTPRWMRCGPHGQPRSATWPAWASTCSTAQGAAASCWTTTKSDFGKHIIPELHRNRTGSSATSMRVIGRTSGPFARSGRPTSSLTDTVPEFNFYDPRAPIYTTCSICRRRKINCCDLNRCLLSEGCIISGHRILHSIVGIRAVVGDGAVIEHSVLMGADYFEKETPKGLPKIGVGRDCYHQECHH